MQALEDLCCNYDWTVRNSMGEIVQFNYGIDGLDPSAMEDNCMPVDFPRVMHHVKVVGNFTESFNNLRTYPKSCRLFVK